MPQSDNPSNKLTNKQSQFVAAYVSTTTLMGACKQIGISDETGRRWLVLPHVKQAVDAAREEIFTSSLELLKQAVQAAVRTLLICMKEEMPASVRLRAAQVTLEQALSVHKITDLEAKIADLETLIRGTHS